MAKTKFKGFAVVMLAIVMAFSLCLGIGHLAPKSSAKAETAFKAEPDQAIDFNAWHTAGTLSSALSPKPLKLSFDSNGVVSDTSAAKNYFTYETTTSYLKMNKSSSTLASGDLYGLTTNDSLNAEVTISFNFETETKIRLLLGVDSGNVNGAYTGTLSGATEGSVSITPSSKTDFTCEIAGQSLSLKSKARFLEFTLNSGVTNLKINPAYLTDASAGSARKLFIYAVEAYYPASYTLSYDVAGGTGSYPDEVVAPESATTNVNATAPTAPEGKKFKHWSGSDGKTYAPGASITLSGNVTLTAVYDVIVTEIEQPASIVKVYVEGMTAENLGLPETVVGKTAFGDADLSVAWSTEAIELNATYEDTISGTASVGDGYVFADEVDGAVTISIKLMETAPNVESIEAPETVRVLKGGSVEGLLPETVKGTIDGKTVELKVTWDTESLNLDVASTYTLPGTVAESTDYVVPETVTVSLLVEVYTLKITEIKPVQEVTVEVGDTNAAARLPETVAVVLENGEEVQIPVVWDTFSTETATTLTVNGTLTLDDTPYTNDDALEVTITVNVVEVSSAAWFAYPDGSGDNFGVNWTTVYTDRVLASKDGFVITALSAASSDTDHDMTKPLVKVSKSTAQGIEVVVPLSAIDVKLTVYASVYSGTGHIQVSDGTTVIGSNQNVTAVCNGGATEYTAITPDKLEVSLESGKTYYIGTGDGANVYFTGVEISGLTVETWNVSFETGDEGDPVDDMQAYKNGEIILPEVTAHEGYAFKGWTTDAEGHETLLTAGSTYQVLEDGVTLYAQYTVLTVAIDGVFTDKTVLEATIAAAADQDAKIAALGLETTVEITLGDGTTATAEVEWDYSEMIAAGFAINSYTVSGTVTLPAEHPAAPGLSLTISRKVNIYLDLVTISSFEYQEQYDVELGTEFTVAELPSTINARDGQGGLVENLEVSWTEQAVDTSAVGDVTIEGTVTIPDGYELKEGVSATITVTVNVYNYAITSVEAIEDIHAIVNLAAPALPATVTVHYTDHDGADATTTLAVTWDNTDTINMAVVAVYPVEGTVVGTALYTVDAAIKAHVNVVVEEYAAVSEARSTYFGAYSSYSAGSFHGFTISGSVSSANFGGKGIGIKQGGISFTLNAPASVTFVYCYGKDNTYPTLDGTTSFAAAANALQVRTVELEAGAHSLAADTNSGSFCVVAIIINDGASEVFYAESTATLPAMPAKTIGGVAYEFMGWTDAAGSEVYSAGDEVQNGFYYAIYLTAHLNHSAALRVEPTKGIKFTAEINALNAEVYLANLINGGKFTAEVTLTADGGAVEVAAPTASADKLLYRAVHDVLYNTAVYEFSAHFAFNETEILTDSVSCTPKQLAETTLGDLKTETEGGYKFQTDNGFSYYTDEEREALGGYLADDSESKPNPNPDPNPDDEPKDTPDDYELGEEVKPNETWENSGETEGTVDDTMKYWYVQDAGWNCGSVVTMTAQSYADGIITLAYSGGDRDFSVQLFYNNTSLKAGTDYFVRLTIELSADLDIKLNDKVMKLTAGTHEIYAKFNTSTENLSSLDLQLSGVGEASVEVKISNIRWQEILGEKGGEDGGDEGEDGPAIQPTARVIEITSTDFYAPGFVKIYMSEEDLTFIRDNAAYVMTNDQRYPHDANKGFLVDGTLCIQVQFTDGDTQFECKWYNEAGEVIATCTFEKTDA